MFSFRKFVDSRKKTKGVWRAIRQLAIEVVIFWVHCRGVWRARRYRGQRKLRVHLGCGLNQHPGWVNVDLFCSKRADLRLDLRQPLPLDDGSAALIYSEHFMEHLGYPEETMGLLASCFRVLEPGGCVSIGVPDTEACLKAYVEGDAEKFRINGEKWCPKWCETPMDQVNYHFRQINEHQYAYDFETLAGALRRAGFVDVVRRQWDPELDSPGWKGSDTLYVKATKPGLKAA